LTDDEIILDAENHLKTDHPGFTWGRVVAPHCLYNIVNIGKNGNRDIKWSEWNWKNHIEELGK